VYVGSDGQLVSLSRLTYDSRDAAQAAMRRRVAGAVYVIERPEEPVTAERAPDDSLRAGQGVGVWLLREESLRDGSVAAYWLDERSLHSISAPTTDAIYAFLNSARDGRGPDSPQHALPDSRIHRTPRSRTSSTARGVGARLV
jgi:hypothetical protein